MTDRRNRARVLKYIEDHPKGSCCEDWERDLKMKHQTASALLTELSREKLIQPTGQKSFTKSGRPARMVVLADQPSGFF